MPSDPAFGIVIRQCAAAGSKTTRGADDYMAGAPEEYAATASTTAWTFASASMTAAVLSQQVSFSPTTNVIFVLAESAFAPGGDVARFSIGPDGSVVYKADQDDDDVFELYASTTIFVDGFGNGDTSAWPHTSL